MTPLYAIPSRDFGLRLAIGGALLALLGVYGVATGSGASPRYPAALIALGLASIARALAARSEHRAVQRAPGFFYGVAGGLLLAGLFD